MPLLNFLKAILPNEGHKCWASIQNKKAINHFCTSFEELADQILRSDARGVDTYHACASFKTPQNRRQANALGAKAFWCDIDVGEGKPYATVEDAIQACDEFCDRSGLDVPGLVRSGGGLHAYWVLDTMLPANEWSHLAGRLKLLIHNAGFNADPSRTADIASLLRPPLTHNHKIPSHPRLVTVDDFDLFEPCANITGILVNAPLGTQSQLIKNSLTPDKPNGNLVAGLKSAFDASAGVAQGSRGSTLLKYAGELVAKHHGWDEVLAKGMAWNQLCQPPQDDAEVRRVVKSAFDMHARNHPSPAAALPANELPPMKVPGFTWGPNNELMAIVMEDNGKEKVQVKKVVAWLPVYLKSWMNEEGYKIKNSYLFSHFHPTDGWQDFAMGAKEFNGGEWYGQWTENGCSIVDGMDKLFKSYVRRHENMLRLNGGMEKRYTQFGWKDDDKAFLVGNSLCGADGTVRKAVGTEKLSPMMLAMQPARGGSLDAWTAAADKLFSPGMEAHGFMLLASFASTLMKFCVDQGNGGSILSIISEESGYGKTPMAVAASSVWGEMGATMDTGNFTSNRIIEDLVRHCHIIQIQEEGGGYGDPMVMAQNVEKFTSGTDRGRLTQGGAATGIPERYQTILMTLSNKSLYELVRSVNVPMSRRIFEIEIERPSKDDMANIGGIGREMMRNCGHAGLAFARVIVEPSMRQYITEHLTGQPGGRVGSTQLRYRDKLQSQPEHRFIVWLLSAMDVAARVLNHCGILHFDVERVMAWGVEQAQLRTLGDGGSICADATARKLDSFIREHMENCLTVAGPYDSKRVGTVPHLRAPLRKLCLRMEMNPARMLIAQDAMQTWCNKNNISFKKFGRELREGGILLESSRSLTLAAGTDFASGRTLCWVIDMKHPAVSGELRATLREELKVLAV